MAALTKHSDQELAALLKAGDRAAFAEIYARYKGLLYIHAFNKLRNEAEADDIVHDLFATLWDKREELNITGYLSGYLYTSVRNRILKLIEKNSNAKTYMGSLAASVNAGTCVTDHLVRQHMLSELIEKAVAELPTKMRIVFELSRKGGLTHKEIARELDISEETVKSHITHALKLLRLKLGLFVYLFLSIHYIGQACNKQVTDPADYRETK